MTAAHPECHAQQTQHHCCKRPSEMCLTWWQVGKTGASVGFDTKEAAASFADVHVKRLEQSSLLYAETACSCTFEHHNVFIPASRHQVNAASSHHPHSALPCHHWCISRPCMMSASGPGIKHGLPFNARHMCQTPAEPSCALATAALRSSSRAWNMDARCNLLQFALCPQAPSVLSAYHAEHATCPITLA